MEENKKAKNLCEECHKEAPSLYADRKERKWKCWDCLNKARV